MKAFVSSTSLDLGEYRQAAYEVCNRLQIVPIGMEQFESMGVGATEGSRRKVDEADVYVGIVANRYGYVEDGYDRSVTELEFDRAGERSLDRLCFVADEAAHLPVYPEYRAELDAFKSRIGKLIRNTFSNAWEFKYKLYDSLLKWLFRQRGSGPLLRHVFEPLFDDYARFAGREGVLAEIQAFLEAPGPSCLVLTAPAGFGKTALAVKLIELHREITAYHFFAPLYGPEAGKEILSESFFLRNVVEQLKLWHPAWDGPGESPTSLADWIAAYQRLLGLPLPEPRVLLIDGLDEVKSWSLRPYLGALPADNLKVILTVRDVGQDWAADYDLPKAHRHLAIDGLERDDVRALFHLTGPVARDFAGDPMLLDKVMATAASGTGHDRADPLYVSALADDIQERRVTAANIDAQPKGLAEYLDRWWQALVAQAGEDSAVLDLLGTLAAALGPMGREELIEINPSLKPSWTQDRFRAALGSVRRTVAGSDAGGYRLAHPRYRGYIRQFEEARAYDQKLRDHCRNWPVHRGPYALAQLVQHLAQAGATEELFATVLDPDFQGAQREGLGSVRPTLSDLETALRAALDRGDFLRVLRCAGSYRRLSRTGGVARAVFLAAEQGDFAAAAKNADALGSGASGAWVLALRCYLVWEAAQASRPEAVVALAEAFGRQLGLEAHGGRLHTAPLCDALIAQAVEGNPSAAPELGVGLDWAADLARRLSPPPLEGGALQDLLPEIEPRLQSLDPAMAENPSMVEFIDEERAGDFVSTLRDALVRAAPSDEGRDRIDRGLGLVGGNPYPRYRDNALVALGIAALAAGNPAWARRRLQTIVEIGLEKAGVAFTFDLAAQLAAEAQGRGLPAGGLPGYLQPAEASLDRWGTAMRAASARAAAERGQGRAAQAFPMLEAAAAKDQGFAGYLAAHLLALACRWCEFGLPARVAELDLITRSRSHAERVRDPRFRDERIALVSRFESWLADPVPDEPEASAALRATGDPDARRAYVDLVSARWAASGERSKLERLVPAALGDGTTLDFLLARLATQLFRQHREGLGEFSDAALKEAIKVCEEDLATERPWEFGAPAYA